MLSEKTFVRLLKRGSVEDKCCQDANSFNSDYNSNNSDSRAINNYKIFVKYVSENFDMVKVNESGTNNWHFELQRKSNNIPEPNSASENYKKYFLK